MQTQNMRSKQLQTVYKKQIKTQSDGLLMLTTVLHQLTHQTSQASRV